MKFPGTRRYLEDIFLDNVLAYANVNESRDPWRKEFYDLCMPLIKDCKTPGAAAALLNRSVFPKLKVGYSTQRKKPHQSPRESIEQGKASCTGLSIILSDACRSVAIPARLVGTPLWSNNSGNHTWVEVWDNGWHFTGACEPDPKGLDRGWFVGNAAQAKKDSAIHAIYAASFRKTPLSFPMVWSPGRKDVYAENVTDHYNRASVETKAAVGDLNAQQPQGCRKGSAGVFCGATELAPNGISTPNSTSYWPAMKALSAPPSGAAYQAAPIHGALKKDFDKQQARNQQHVSPYKVREVGQRPKNGWPLVIAMHGGGNSPQELNDSQWRHMEKHYRDQAALTGYKYLALRAPNNTWNGFYDEYVPPLIINLIRQFAIFGDVDTDKVFILGYSHGGYGAFYIGPKIPDRFAAVHASAAAPTDGTISPLQLAALQLHVHDRRARQRLWPATAAKSSLRKSNGSKRPTRASSPLRWSS